MIPVILGKKAVPEKDAVRIGIDHKGKLMGRVENNTVGGFRTDPLDLQQNPAQGFRILGQKVVYPAFEPGIDPIQEIFQTAGLQVEIPARPDFFRKVKRMKL